MPGNTLDIEDLLETPDDPRFIAGVYDYCHRRCDRCPFTERCRLYADERHGFGGHATDDWQDRVHRSFEKTIELLKKWCGREGVDFDRVGNRASSDRVNAELRVFTEARQDPLLKLAERYTFAALQLSKKLRSAARFNTWPPEAHEALKTVEWFAMRVASKLLRALTGYVRRLDEARGVDLLQSDWNGSAKVARLDIAESRAAWNVLLTAGRTASDSPMWQIIELLDRVDAGVAERFPDAMAFVRPGFDDPGLLARRLPALGIAPTTL